MSEDVSPKKYRVFCENNINKEDVSPKKYRVFCENNINKEDVSPKKYRVFCENNINKEDVSPKKYRVFCENNINKEDVSPKKYRVFCNMVADMFHYGHMRFIEKVRAKFDEPIYLVIGLTSDEDCLSYKRKPILTFEERILTVKASKLADEIMMEPAPLVETIEFLDEHKFDYTAHGDDFDVAKMETYYGEIIKENRLIITPYEKNNKISTSELIERIRSRYT
jgi:cytidyltransferase-like protein